jgi:hypothetical protein
MRLPISCGIASLIFLCSCATQETVQPSLPAETAFTETAFIKDPEHIYLTLHLENGKELLFVMDTGATWTVLDKSLEPILGERLGTKKIRYAFYGKTRMDVYNAPELYLGNTRLLTGKRVFTDDLRRIQKNPPIMGILGMDCLRHYCIQLDFAGHKIRFLDPSYSESERSVERFSLIYGFFDGIPSVRANFFGQSNARWEIDTGLAEADVAATPKQLRELNEQAPRQSFIISAHDRPTNRLAGTFYFSPEIIFNNGICTNFIWRDARGKNLIGPRFLSRYLITLNFPKRTMYLERGSTGSLADNDNVTNFLGNTFAYDFLYTFIPEAEKILEQLAKNGQLPGCAKSKLDEPGELNLSWHEKNIHLAGYPISETFVLTKKGRAFQYHYTVLQSSKTSPLKLEKAWRTDSSGHVIEKYPVP